MATIYGHESGYIRNKRDNYGMRRLILFAFLLIVIYLFAKYSPTISTSNPHIWVIIVVFLVVVKVFELLFNRQDRGYRKTGRGIKGEDDIVHELKKLPDEYTVFRNVSLTQGRDIDCIVIGPNGVFTIESKSHSGRIDFNGRELTLNGTPFWEKNVLAQAMGEAMDVHKFLRERLNREVFVTPILVFAGKYASIHFGMKPIHGVHVIQKSWLLNLITTNHGKVENTEEIIEVLR